MSSAPEITPRSTLLVLFCCLMAFSSVTWNLPPSKLQEKIIGVSKYVMIPLDLWQSWTLFSHPMPQASVARVARTYPDGQFAHDQEALRQRPGYSLDPMRIVYLNIVGDQRGDYATSFLRRHCERRDVLGKPSRVTLQVAQLPVPMLNAPSGNHVDPFSMQPAYVNLRSVQCPK